MTGETKYCTCPYITRYPEPVLTCRDVPYESALTFNAGITKDDKGYVMLFRNDYGCTQTEWEIGKRFKGTNIGLARSTDGIKWDVYDRPVFELKSDEFDRAYDPRITYLEGRYYITFAADTKHGIRGGICVTDDFLEYEILSLSTPDNRNMVLFPEKINGRYIRLERPMPVYSREGREQFDIWMSASCDLKYWGDSALVLGCEAVPFCNSKIGPAAPPLKTSEGWLTTYHAVDYIPDRGKNGWEEYWKKRYMIGIMLLDLEDPSRVIGKADVPLMVPEGREELEGGFRNDALFPCGMIRGTDGRIMLYYSAGDKEVRLAYADENDFIAFCKAGRTEI